MHQISEQVAPSYSELRPLRTELLTSTFPVYRGLVDRLVTATDHPNAVVAHVLSTCSGYAYSDAHTVAMIMSRLGLEDNRCLMVDQSVDAMFIRSTAFVVQSRCGRVVIVGYRGTEPENGINWLTDADISPEKVSFGFPGTPGSFFVHGGFYRNVRATRYEVVHALARALQGKSVLRHTQQDTPVEYPLEALYFTGHSLGGAMAALLGVMLATDPDYAALEKRLKGVYTYGQPMIGDAALASACDQHPSTGARPLRYVYAHDVVPSLPPRAAGDFAHFGPERHFDPAGGTWSMRAATQQLPSLLELSGAALAFVAKQLKPLRKLPLPYSIDDHLPQHYISALTPQGVRSEFGD
jgi:hypothetical protein